MDDLDKILSRKIKAYFVDKKDLDNHTVFEDAFKLAWKFQEAKICRYLTELEDCEDDLDVCARHNVELLNKLEPLTDKEYIEIWLNSKQSATLETAILHFAREIEKYREIN